MPFIGNLTKISRVGESTATYIPATIANRLIGLARMLLLVMLMPAGEYGLWSAGAMIFVLGSFMFALGLDQAIARYVSFHQAGGSLRQFARRMLFVATFCIAVLACIAAAFADQITSAIFPPQIAGGFTFELRRAAVLLAVANGAAMASQMCMGGFIQGMRAYRLAAAMELVCGILFTGAALTAAWFIRDGAAMAVLWANLGATLVATIAGLLAAAWMVLTGNSGEASSPKPSTERTAPPIFKFAIAALASTMAYQCAAYLSYWLTQRKCGESVGAIFAAMMTLSQPVQYLASAGWGILLSHAAGKWESARRDESMRLLTCGYKAGMIVIILLAAGMLATAKWWLVILPEHYRDGANLLPGLLLMFSATASMGYLGVLTKIHHRPFVYGLACVVAMGINLAIAAGVGAWSSSAQLAMSAGLGMYIAATGATIIYCLLTKTRADFGTIILAAAPIILLNSTSAIAGAATMLLLLASGAILSAKEKSLLTEQVRTIFRKTK